MNNISEVKLFKNENYIEYYSAHRVYGTIIIGRWIGNPTSLPTYIINFSKKTSYIRRIPTIVMKYILENKRDSM